MHYKGKRPEPENEKNTIEKILRRSTPQNDMEW